ncbi:MAG: hypothetical protein GXO20_01685 [Thermodesulfobacteria bacterium]|nr:hypothetical protein [Thermodesulfobacteriota bacterium]
MKKLLGLFFLVLLMVACGKPRDLTIYPPLEKIAVLPFEPICPGQKEDEITCAFAGKIVPGEVATEAASILTELLYQKLSGNPRFILVPEDKALRLWAEVLSEYTGASAYKLIAEIGKRLGVDAVLYGKVFRYREREGTGFAVVRPASVAFALILVRVSDGRVIWRGWFDETQKPLSENVLSLKLYGKIRWLTAKELAERGLEKVLEEFPYLKSS